jgi:hypothetical protein
VVSMLNQANGILPKPEGAFYVYPGQTRQRDQ